MCKVAHMDLSFQLYFPAAFLYMKESANPIQCYQRGLRVEDRVISFPGRQTPAAYIVACSQNWLTYSDIRYLSVHSFIVAYFVTFLHLHVKLSSPRPKSIITKFITWPTHLVAGRKFGFNITVYVKGTAVTIFITAKRWT